MFTQEKWTNPNYKYTIEIPEGFKIMKALGADVDFKASDGIGSIVIVVNKIPPAYQDLTIEDLFGSLENYVVQWEVGAQEHLDRAKVIKFGKTTFQNEEAIWFDQISENPKTYTKIYQVVHKNLLFTFTLSSSESQKDKYAILWFRFKNKLKF